MPDHERYRQWLDSALNAKETFAVSELVLSAFVRVSTLSPVFSPTEPIERTLEFANSLRSHPNSLIVRPGERHWEIFTRLCLEVNARGNLVPDAYLAALAIEADCELISADRDFSRFPGLRWRHPLN